MMIMTIQHIYSQLPRGTPKLARTLSFSPEAGKSSTAIEWKNRQESLLSEIIKCEVPLLLALHINTHSVERNWSGYRINPSLAIFQYKVTCILNIPYTKKYKSF
jgi:hypothetical protein